MGNQPNLQKPLPSRSLARYGCYLGLLVAALFLVHSLYNLATGGPQPMPLKLAILTAGVLQAVTCWLALQGNRVAWSFALSLNGTLFLIFIFGAPRVRDGWEVSMALSMVPAVAFAALTLLLSLGSHDYGSRS